MGIIPLATDWRQNDWMDGGRHGDWMQIKERFTYIMRYEGMSMAGSIVLGNFRAGHKITLLDVQWAKRIWLILTAIRLWVLATRVCWGKVRDGMARHGLISFGAVLRKPAGYCWDWISIVAAWLITDVGLHWNPQTLSRTRLVGSTSKI